MRLLCVCPNPAIDYTAVVPQISGGQTVRAVQSVASAGGKALNVARFANGFGARASAATWLGEAESEFVLSLARRDGLVLEASVVPGTWVRVCPILVSEADGLVVAVSGSTPTISGKAWSDFVALAARAAERSDVVCVAGSFPLVTGVEPFRALLQGIGSSRPVWVDTSGSALRAAASLDGLALKVNLSEAQELLGGDVAPPTASKREQSLAAAEAMGRDGRDVVVTAGSAGAASSTAAGLRWCDSPTVESRNPTASGDAFMAGYLCAGRAELADIHDPLRAAVLAGAVNARSWTPSAPPEMVRSLHRQV